MIDSFLKISYMRLMRCKPQISSEKIRKMETVSVERFRKGMIVMLAVGVATGIGLQRLILSPIGRILVSKEKDRQEERRELQEDDRGTNYQHQCHVDEYLNRIPTSAVSEYEEAR
jgi:hypothetical protein